MDEQLQITTPRPDPTVRTSEALLREITAVKEICGKDKEIIETRLVGNDKAIELLQKATDRIPDFVDSAVRRLQELHSEKFSSIDKQFIERDVRTEQGAKVAQVAIDAAFKSAGEAVSKTETSFTKQIDQQREVIQQTTKTTDDKINDLKDRLGVIENRTSSSEGRTKGSGDTWGVIIGVVGVAIGVVGVLIAIAAIAVRFVQGGP